MQPTQALHPRHPRKHATHATDASTPSMAPTLTQVARHLSNSIFYDASKKPALVSEWPPS